MGRDERARLAEAVRRECLRVLLEAHERGGFAGLCAEGRFELAVDAVRSLSLEAVLQDAADDDDGPSGP